MRVLPVIFRAALHPGGPAAVPRADRRRLPRLQPDERVAVARLAGWMVGAGFTKPVPVGGQRATMPVG